MALVLFTIGGTVMNALAFSGTSSFFSKLTDHGEKDRKRHDLALEKLQKDRDNGIKIEQNGLILSIKGCVKRMKQEHSSTMLMKQCLSTIKYLQNK